MNFLRYSCLLIIVASLFIFSCNAELKVGKQAPDINAQAIVDGEIRDISLFDDYRDQYKVICFYPLDFTFVCPTELHALQAQIEEFKKRNVVVFAVSVDSVYAHLEWLSKSKETGGIQGVTYPLISDITKVISRDYGVLIEDGIALRGTFILDRDNSVQAALINNLPIGRSVDEIIRLIDAMQHVESHGQVCPANWHEGEDAIEPTHEAVSAYLQGNN